MDLCISLTELKINFPESLSPFTSRSELAKRKLPKILGWSWSSRSYNVKVIAVRDDERQVLESSCFPCSLSFLHTFVLVPCQIFLFITSSAYQQQPGPVAQPLGCEFRTIAMKRQPSMAFYPSPLCDLAADVSHFQISLKALTCSPRLVLKRAN